MTMSIFEFFKAEKVLVRLTMEYNGKFDPENDIIESIFVKLDEKYYEVELCNAYLNNSERQLDEFVEIKSDLDKVIHDWNEEHGVKVLDVKIEKIE